MEGFSFLLRKKKRRILHDLVHFLDALSLNLQAGYDLSYAWPVTLGALRHSLCVPLRDALTCESFQNGGMGKVMQKLSRDFPVFGQRVWFSVLGELYLKGAGLHQGIQAFSDSLRKELGREIEDHCRSLPTKVNVLMLVFFLPPTLFLLFAPFLIEILSIF